MICLFIKIAFSLPAVLLLVVFAIRPVYKRRAVFYFPLSERILYAKKEEKSLHSRTVEVR